MKKYLFLLFLFLTYILLILKNNLSTEPVISYDNESGNVVDVVLKFEDGINSKILSNLFKNYDKEYYVYGINLDNEKIDLSCNKIDICLEEIFSQEDNDFSMLNITSGFKIDTVKFIAYKDEIVPFLDRNELVYEIK